MKKKQRNKRMNGKQQMTTSSISGGDDSVSLDGGSTGGRLSMKHLWWAFQPDEPSDCVLPSPSMCKYSRQHLKIIRGLLSAPINSHKKEIIVETNDWKVLEMCLVHFLCEVARLKTYYISAIFRLTLFWQESYLIFCNMCDQVSFATSPE